MEQSDNYSKADLKVIFDTVNSNYMKFKGREKTIAKNQFVNVWKQDNKGLSAFQLMIHLYKAEEIIDSKNEFFQQFLEDTGMSVDEVKSKKPIKYAKHIKHMRSKDQAIEDLELELDNVLEDNNLISKDESDETIKALKREHKLVKEEQDNKIIKLEHELNMIGKDLDSKLNIKDQQIEYYKNLSEKLLADQ